MLSNRGYSILLQLLNSDDFVKIADLAEYYCVSIRVIYYDIENINLYLDEIKIAFPLTYLLLKDGYLKIVSDKDLNRVQKLKEYILQGSKSKIILSPGERILEILYMISRNMTIKISDMIEEFNVSKSTIVKDLDYVKAFYSDHGVELKYLQGKGFSLQGDELVIRLTTASFMEQILKENNYLFRMHDEEMIWQLRPLSLWNELLPYKALAEIIKKYLNELDMPSILFNHMLLGILFSIQRGCEDKAVFLSDKLDHLINDATNIKAAQLISKEISKKICVSDVDLLVKTIALLSLGLVSNFDSLLDIFGKLDLKVTASNFVKEVCKQTNLEVDESLIVSIRNEIIKILVGFDTSLITPQEKTISLIQEEYSALWNCVKVNSKYLENQLNRKLNDNQLMYLVLNFIELYEKQQIHFKNKPNVLIVCNGGIVVSQLITSRLQAIFHINIVGTANIYELNDFLDHYDIDYLISTVPIMTKKVKCLKVSSYVGSDDLNKLSKILPSKHINQDIIIQIVKSAEYHGKLNNRVAFLKDVANLLNIQGNLQLNDDIGPNLCEIIIPQCIKLDIGFSTLSDAVKESADMLFNYGYINQSYVEEVVDTVKHSAQYMIIGDRIIMPHSMAGKHTYKTGISIIRLENPIPIYSGSDIEVKWIFTLCTIDKKNHINALIQLANMISNNKILEEMKNAKSPADLMDLFFKYSNQ